MRVRLCVLEGESEGEVVCVSEGESESEGEVVCVSEGVCVRG